ncbi:flagellar biosynthetic protein FliQ [Ferrimonas lipolytica]|uniref:Flagellar biosynthetic protein FliQ n=1 Tax=Ferrimonas lipolytica TaxID=2724191 RepID=A0A6H1UCI7_9GAMM|nr:flagellar biosynthetic protein FliQ [Ferrimonas lipolytica]QIZ76817.1 flagellar biosynthetic protein FliQ [Ferrimonas lipolytica]
MTDLSLTSVFSDAIIVVIKAVSALVIPGLLLGVLIAVFQAATQVNEQTLSFLPKLILTLAVLLLCGQWLLGLIIDFFNFLFFNIPNLIS